MKDYDYAYFEKILKAKGLKAIDVSRATGIATSTLSDWKAGRTTPKDDKIRKICDFLNVSQYELRTGKKPVQIDLSGIANSITKAMDDTNMTDQERMHYELQGKAMDFYMKYLECDRKTRNAIDMLMKEDDE